MSTRPQWGTFAGLTIAAIALWFLLVNARPHARPPTADLSSPESTVKSYWTLRAWTQRNAPGDRQAPTGKPSAAEVMSAVTAGGARDSYTTRSGTRDPLEWSLKRIELTGEQTAVATARARNLSREPRWVTPTPIELFEADARAEFQYLLVREPGGWKVSEVWRVDGSGKRNRVR